MEILDKNTLKKYINLCHELGLGALVEAHDATEVGIALECGARVIGVNNRNLKDFTVDMHNSINLRKERRSRTFPFFFYFIHLKTIE